MLDKVTLGEDYLYIEMCAFNQLIWSFQSNKFHFESIMYQQIYAHYGSSTIILHIVHQRPVTVGGHLVLRSKVSNHLK